MADFMLFRPGGRHRVALRMLKPEAHDEILNVGCNCGYFEHHYLAGRVKLSVGVDIDREAISFAQKNVWASEFVCASSDRMPFEDERFNKILCEDVLEHVDDVEGTLREIARVTRPKGLLVLSVPNDYRNDKDPDFPLHRHYSHERISELLGEAGFQITEVFQGVLFPRTTNFILKFGRTPRLLRMARWLTYYTASLDAQINWGFGYTLVVSAVKK